MQIVMPQNLVQYHMKTIGLNQISQFCILIQQCYENKGDLDHHAYEKRCIGKNLG